MYGLDAFGSHNDFRHWLRSAGYPEKYAPDGSGPGWDDDSVVEAFFRQVVELGDRVTPPFAYTLDYVANEAYNSAYSKGETAMKLIWSNLVEPIRDTLGTDSLMTIPPGQGTHRAMFVRPSLFFSVAASSQRSSLAGRFLTFFLGDVEANRILAAERGVPVVPAVREALQQESSRQVQVIFEYVDFVAHHSSPGPTAIPVNIGVLREVFEETTRLVAFHHLTPAEGAVRLRQEWTALMSR